MATHITNPSEELVSAAFLAREYYAGQFSGLYKLQCGEWDALTLQDYRDACCEFQAVLDSGRFDDDDAQALHGAVNVLDDAMLLLVDLDD
tara:strand:+ start:91 stop:360 length:270 start_codon:yes stop_codon:yes gene_type:complete